MVLHCSCSLVALRKICKSLSVLLSIFGIPNYQSSSVHQLMIPAPRTAFAFLQLWFNIKYKTHFREVDLDHVFLFPSPSHQASRPERQRSVETPSHPAPAAERAARLPQGQDSTLHTVSFSSRRSLLKGLNWNDFSFSSAVHPICTGLNKNLYRKS